MTLILALIFICQLSDEPVHQNSDNGNWSYFIRENSSSKFDVCVFPTGTGRYIKSIHNNPKAVACQGCLCPLCECDTGTCIMLGNVLTTNDSNYAMGYNSVIRGKSCLKISFDFNNDNLCKNVMYLDFTRENPALPTVHRPKHVIDPKGIQRHSWKSVEELISGCK